MQLYTGSQACRGDQGAKRRIHQGGQGRGGRIPPNKDPMPKTILHKLFGAGKIPKKYAPTLTAESIVLLDEGIGGSITFKNFRAPGRRYAAKKSWFTGCLVLTEQTFAAFALHKPLIYVPLTDERIVKLNMLNTADTLKIYMCCYARGRSENHGED